MGPSAKVAHSCARRGPCLAWPPPCTARLQSLTVAVRGGGCARRGPERPRRGSARAAGRRVSREGLQGLSRDKAGFCAVSGGSRHALFRPGAGPGWRRTAEAARKPRARGTERTGGAGPAGRPRPPPRGAAGGWGLLRRSGRSPQGAAGRWAGRRGRAPGAGSEDCGETNTRHGVKIIGGTSRWMTQSEASRGCCDQMGFGGLGGAAGRRSGAGSCLPAPWEPPAAARARPREAGGCWAGGASRGAAPMGGAPEGRGG
ncbi:MAG: hypothetical protein J3K34DRAFT_405586 [Monoraphidium minutum]|nr:MAG: hypothetical protein J3K34DRAFT_405586 [Monoraphidium minutum]